MLWGEPVFDHRAVLAAQVHCLSNIEQSWMVVS